MATSPNDIELASIRSASESASRAESTAPIAASSSRGEVEGETKDQDQPPANREAFESYPENAWGQVLACFLLLSTSVGGIYTWGVWQSKLTAEGLAPTSTIVFIGSAQATVQAAAALLNTRLVAHYGARNVALVGSFLLSLGPILAGCCTHSLAGLILTEGICFGAGQSLIFFAAAPHASTYFQRRRNIATGIAYAGGGVGGAVFSLVAAQLLNRTNLPNAFRIMGAIFGAINIPSALALRSRGAREPFLPQKKIIDRTLFKDPRFVLLLLGTSVALFPLFVPPFFLPLYAENALGLSSTTSSAIVAAYNCSSAVGRIAFGLIADAGVGSLNSLVLCLIFCTVSTLVIWPLATSIVPLVIFGVINGLSAGGMFSLIPGAISSVFGSSNLGVIFSMLVTAWVPGYLLGSPIAGYLIKTDVPVGDYGAYRPAIFYAGALSSLSTVLILAVRLRANKKVFKKM